ncbi:NAD-dependent dehydratase [Pandoraea horticolens]|uniref:NAD-dependent dehydratase n=1 Tax=Pandoraea horticolens TaxID=2508298 RepID=A0A5E4ZDM4_9BURK|nr:NAD(P)-dependent oxidoreductase [Pandoraea horticolens]VVE58632.1 NAD-dependent dehydratase [Pandoraea horticolens]
MKILVTGASGFVGRSFIRRFSSRADVQLHGVARSRLNLPNYTSADLSLPFDLPFKPDAVIHGAARASPWGTPAQFEQQNVDATKEVIRFCERNGCPKLVYLSSSSVFYRHEHQFGITEDSPIGPSFVNEYARTKYLAEELVHRYQGSWVILRPRAVFGPGDTVLFPRILAAAAKGRLPLFVNEGTPAVGDLIYIESLCDYLLTAATRPDIRGCFNVTNNQPVPIQDFLLITLDRLGLPIPSRQVKLSTAMLTATLTEAVWRLLHLPGEPPITRFGVSVFAYSKTFDVTRAITAMGPPSVDLIDGVERFVRWQRSQ